VGIEAMASGRPVIAYRGGDIPEHIEEGKTGIFFERQTPEDIIAAVEKFRDSDYDQNYIREKAQKFDKKIFKEKIKNYIEKELAEHLERKEMTTYCHSERSGAEPKNLL